MLYQTHRLPTMFLVLLWVALLIDCTLAQNATFRRGQKFQIILLGVPDVSKVPLPPTDAPVWDVDLFDTPATTISALKAAGKIVICYFSAGTAEDWRDDYRDFAATDLGKVLPEWPNEKWVKTGSQGIRTLMAKRIKLAADKGCDAIDPDNTDGYQNDSGLSLTPADAISYLTFLSATATTYSLSLGLKNSLSILPSVSSLIDFAVNEQCFQLGECTAYTSFLASNKPVFNIEYPQPLNAASVQGPACRNPVVGGMSTVLKDLTLDGRSVYCDGGGVVVNTPTVGGSSPPRPSRPPKPVPTASSTRPVGPSRSVTTVRSTVTRSQTSTPTQRPTGTPGGGGGGGCRSKHWDQCGGQNWNGCTVCESPYTCKGVSPPWYYQCL